MIRELNKSEEIPYNLLLLADETVAGIDQYIHNIVAPPPAALKPQKIVEINDD